MEANHLEDLKSSSEETDDIRTGRSYECVFCKRGFTTAQALGGHMNIHRKDRAKSRPSSTSVPMLLSGNKVDDDDENYTSLKSYYHPHYSIAPDQVHASTYQAFFPVSSAGWGFRPSHTDELLFVDNSQHLSLRIGPSQEKKKADGCIEEADQLDLELRLGHGP